jgi:hypothetical protein
LPQISRNSNMFTRSRKKRGFQKKVISTWDWVYAGGIAVGIFLLSQAIGGIIMKKMKGEGE